MGKPKKGRAKDGGQMHYSVGAIIQQKGKYLLINRAVPPFGFAGIAGHVDENEEPVEALKREVKEESGLTVRKADLLAEEEINGNWCSKGIHVHYWYLFKCTATGKITRNIRETKSIKWYTREEIKNLTLEPVWAYWFEKFVK